jgi:hypothetical protein
MLAKKKITTPQHPDNDDFCPLRYAKAHLLVLWIDFAMIFHQL